jgi:hypothetical protein
MITGESSTSSNAAEIALNVGESSTGGNAAKFSLVFRALRSKMKRCFHSVGFLPPSEETEWASNS